MIFSMLTNSQLCRAITTTKNYIIIDIGYSCNHSAGKVTFSNNLPVSSDNDRYIIADLACDITALQGAVNDMINRISRALTRDCYYDTLENNLKSYGLTEFEYQKALKWIGN